MKIIIIKANVIPRSSLENHKPYVSISRRFHTIKKSHYNLICLHFVLAIDALQLYGDLCRKSALFLFSPPLFSIYQITQLDQDIIRDYSSKSGNRALCYTLISPIQIIILEYGLIPFVMDCHLI